MNEWERMRNKAQMYKSMYPTGTRVLLVSMGDDPQRVEDNTRGTVMTVDDMGHIHVNLDNGRSLALIPGEDDFRKLTEEELAQEQSNSLEETQSMEQSM